MSNTQTRYTFHNMWGSFGVDNNLLGQMTAVLKPIEHLYDEIKIYSLFPRTAIAKIKKTDRVLNVQYSGEPNYLDPTKFDLNFIPLDPSMKPNAKIVPYLFATEKKNYLDMRHDFLLKSDSEILNIKTNFCCFISSNNVALRRQLFNFINSNIKKVDSYGKMCNTGYVLPHMYWTPEYLEFLRPHKFMLACENKIMDWYCTEKPMCALGGGTVPIYCGSPRLFNYINRDAVIYIPDCTPESLKAAKQQIIELDYNDELYLKKLRTPIFSNPDFDIDYINRVKQLFNVN